jgi:hypothetical protein
MKVAPNCSKVKGQINPQPAMSSVTSSLSLSGRQRATSTSESMRSIPTSITTATSNYDSAPTISSSLAPPPSTSTTPSADLRSVYDYEAQNSDELSIKEGDILHIVEHDDGTGWIKAQLGGQVGMVPANYVEYVGDARSSVDQSTLGDHEYDNDATELDEPNIHNIPTAPPMIMDDYHYNEHHDAISSPVIPTPSLSPPAPSAPTAHETAPLNETVVALYDFEAVNAEELNIQQGDRIIVVKKDDSGWWEGTLNGQTGVFPANYVGPAC